MLESISQQPFAYLQIHMERGASIHLSDVESLKAVVDAFSGLYFGFKALYPEAVNDWPGALHYCGRMESCLTLYPAALHVAIVQWATEHNKRVHVELIYDSYAAGEHTINPTDG